MLVDAIKTNGAGWELLILVHAGFYACAALAFAAVRIPDRPVTEPPEDPPAVSSSDDETPENIEKAEDTD